MQSLALTPALSLRPNPKKNMVYGNYAGADYNLTLFYSIVDFNTFTMGLGNPLPESTLTLCQSRLYPPVRDFGFGLWSKVLYLCLLKLEYGQIGHVLVQLRIV
jgi:hypothetical protein